MAVPTIAAVTPTTGHAGGRLRVVVTGTNFRLPPAPAFGPPASPAYAQQTVRVRFDGETALRVDVVDAHRLEVLAPPYRGDPSANPIAASDVEVTNLNDAGAPIAGETATAADAFTYVRLGLRAPAAEQAPLLVIEELVALFRRQVLPNTRLSPHTDFAEPAAARALAGRLPALYLTDISLPEERGARARPNDSREAAVGGEYTDVFYPTVMHRVEAAVIGVSDHKHELVQLAAAARDALHRTPYLTVVLPSATRLALPLEADVGGIIFDLPPAFGNIRTFTLGLTVRDVELELADPIARQQAVARFVLEVGRAEAEFLANPTEIVE